MSYKKILCVDFDGCIHFYVSKWVDVDVISDKPTKGAIRWLKESIHKYDVQIYSSRSKETCGINAMKEWLEENGMTRYEISMIKFPTQKPAAFMTIDDRCFHFEGKFPTDEYIDNFIPWNKK